MEAVGGIGREAWWEVSYRILGGQKEVFTKKVKERKSQEGTVEPDLVHGVGGGGEGNPKTTKGDRCIEEMTDGRAGLDPVAGNGSEPEMKGRIGIPFTQEVMVESGFT